MPEAQREQLLTDYFDAVHGHGYTFCRVHMGSCDFSLGHYAHLAQQPALNPSGAYDLTGFQIERDREVLLPFIKAAQAKIHATSGKSFKLLASPWSPPAWMKTNQGMSAGGRLLPQWQALWAQCFVKFIEAYENEGVPIWGVTVQNEPEAKQVWESCLYSAQEERDFVRDHLGPALRSAGLGHVKIVVWDHNRDQLLRRASVVYSDPQAAQYVWGAGFHWYGEEHFEQVQLTHDAWPDKHLLFTEGCQERGPHLDSWEVGERYGRHILNDLNRWTVGWIDWNLLLDEQGGPNHVGNYCSAPVLVTQHGQLQHQPSYWFLGHVARFVPPGSCRVVCSSSKESLMVSAFVDPKGGKVVVALNLLEEDLVVELMVHHSDRENAFQRKIKIPGRSMLSCCLA
jgi:glucosylceramidase